LSFVTGQIRSDIGSMSVVTGRMQGDISKKATGNG